MITNGRPLGMGSGQAAATPQGNTERRDGFTAEQWAVVQDAWRAGLETGDATGYARGRNENYAEMLTAFTDATFNPDYRPRSAFRQTGQRRPSKFTHERNETGPELVEQAWASWTPVEMRAREQHRTERGTAA